jgi:hypothetical protein
MTTLFRPRAKTCTSESDESFDASGFIYNIKDPEDDMCSDTSTSGTDDHQEVFEELADKYRFQVCFVCARATVALCADNV